MNPPTMPMRSMRRTSPRVRTFAALAATTVLLGGLTACGGSNDSSKTNGSAGSTSGSSATDAKAALTKWLGAFSSGDADTVCSMQTASFDQHNMSIPTSGSASDQQAACVKVVQTKGGTCSFYMDFGKQMTPAISHLDGGTNMQEFDVTGGPHATCGSTSSYSLRKQGSAWMVDSTF